MDPIDRLQNEANTSNSHVFGFGTYGFIAERDLESSKCLFKIEQYDACCVMCQQAVEKILKHYIQAKVLTSDTRDLLQSHNLTMLAMKSGISELSRHMDKMRIIKEYYYDVRYPGISYRIPDESEAFKAIEYTSDIIYIIKGYIFE